MKFQFDFGLYVIFSIVGQMFTKSYRYYNIDEIHSIFTDLSQNCSQFVKIDYAQHRYKIPSGYPYNNKNITSLNLIVFLTDFDSMNIDRPQVTRFIFRL